MTQLLCNKLVIAILPLLLVGILAQSPVSDSDSDASDLIKGPLSNLYQKAKTFSKNFEPLLGEELFNSYDKFYGVVRDEAEQHSRRVIKKNVISSTTQKKSRAVQLQQFSKRQGAVGTYAYVCVCLCTCVRGVFVNTCARACYPCMRVRLVAYLVPCSFFSFLCTFPPNKRTDNYECGGVGRTRYHVVSKNTCVGQNCKVFQVCRVH